MRQIIMTSPGVLEFRTVDEPGEPAADEIVLEIKNIGVCGSDIHVYHGRHPFTKYPIVQGHEYSALVKAVGKGVTRVKPGQKATARPQLVCGACGPCRRGDYNVCQNLKVQGFQANGCAQDLFVVTQERVVALPDSMSFEQGALVEPAAVGAHSTARASSLTGKNVVVAGAGTIGNLVAQFVLARGAAQVLVSDICDFRLAVARQCGIVNTVNVKTDSFEDAIERVFGKDGFQVGFEAAGSPAAIDNLISSVEKGGEIVVLGVFEEFPRINMGFVGEHELTIIGTLMYRHEDYEEAVAYIARNRIVTAPLVTRHFSFDKYAEAYRYIDARADTTMKVMIDV